MTCITSRTTGGGLRLATQPIAAVCSEGSPAFFPCQIGTASAALFMMDMWCHAPMVHCMIEALLVVGVAVLVLGAFMAFVGWSSH